MRNLIYNSTACFTVALLLCITACSSSKQKVNSTSYRSDFNKRYEYLLAYPVDSNAFPRSFKKNEKEVVKVPSKDWTSGFFAGNLWQIYKLTGNIAYKNKAEEWTRFIEKEKFNNKTHDMGFKVFCSFGQGLEFQKDNYYKKTILESSNTLITRFNKNTGLIRSWDFNKDIWEFPVIIDNMMNLEMLFEASKLSGDNTYKKIAISHAEMTMKNHFREDGSTVHVVVYDTITGAVKKKVTHQGYNDESSWARGQGWAIYGYTMVYRYTKDKRYLDRAEKTAAFYLNHKNLPKDGIPYWDFNDPAIPSAPKDVSAATLIASAMIEMYEYTGKQAYLDYAKKVVSNLNTNQYILSESIKAPFILDHSTGNWPRKDEIDEPIVYADYYLLETLLRLQTINK